MKKQIISILFTLMIFTLAACSNDTVDNTTTNAKSAESNSVPYVIKNKEQENTEVINEIKSTFDTSLIGSTYASGDYEYTVQEDETVHISGYTGSDKEITIPTELDDYLVTGISESAFQANQNIVTLIVPGQIKEIGAKAFCNCQNLTNVTLEDGVQILGTKSFYNCSNISNLSISKSVYKVGEHAWSLCEQIQENIHGLIYVGNVVIDFAKDFDGHIAFDENTKGIADGALDKIWGSNSEKSRLILDETVTFPEGILYIGSGTFANQVNVKNFRIPSSVVEIGNYAMQFEFVNNSYGLYNSNATHKIYGAADSVAEQYAISNKLNFVIISD